MAEITATSLRRHPNLQGYWQFESNFNDTSSNGYNLTATNSPTASSSGKFNNGATFASASNQSARRATTSSANINTTGAQTWVCWYKPTSFSSYQSLMSLASADGSVSRALTPSNDGSNHALYWTIPGLTGSVIATISQLNADTWYHIAGVYDPTAGKMKLFVNGVLDNIGSCSGTPTAISDGNFSIGSRGDSTTVFPLNALVDDAAIYNVALTEQEIVELYNTLPTTNNTASLRLYSTNSDKITITDTSNLKPTGNFTAELWIKTKGTSDMGLFQSYNNVSSIAGFRIAILASTGKIRFASGKNTGTSQGTDFQQVDGNIAVNDNYWHHVACVYDGSNLYIYIDGKLDNSISWTQNPAYNATNYVRIGVRTQNATDDLFFDGYINDVRLFNGTAKTQDQIRADIEATNLALSTNLVSRWSMNHTSGTTVTDSINAYNGTISAANPAWTEDIPYTGVTRNSKSMALSADNSQAIQLTDSSSLRPSGNFTIEAWVKVADGSGSQFIFQSYSENTNVAGIHFFVDSTEKLRIVSGKNTGTTANTDYKSLTGTTTLSPNTWYHVAAVYNGSTLELFVDGVSDGSVAWANNASYAATNYVRIGCGNYTGSNLNHLDGFIDEVRLWSTNRSSTELSNNKSIELTGSESNLSFYWQANGNLRDRTTNYNVLTPVNSPAMVSDPPFVGVNNFTYSFNESVSLVDTNTNAANRVRSFSEVLTLVDSIANQRVYNYIASFTESISIVDTLTRVFSRTARTLFTKKEPERALFTKKTPEQALWTKPNADDPSQYRDS